MRRLGLRLIAILLALLFFGHPPALSQPAEPRIALVVGNGAYAGKPHPTAVNDAGLVAEMLRNARFDVIGLPDADEATLRQSVRNFLDRVAAAGPNAVVAIYLAGYGLQYDSENYFAPVGARLARDTDIPSQALRISDILRPLSGMRVSSIVMLDLAYAHPFAAGAPGLIPGLALIEPDPETLVAFNAAPGTIAPAEPGDYGPYARALYELAVEPGVPIDQVFQRVRLRVHEAGQGAVTPWHAAQMTRPLILFAPADTPVGAAPTPAPVDPEAARVRARPLRDIAPEEAYLIALERDTIPAYEEFIAAFPDHPLAARVQRLIAERREALFWRRTLARNSAEAYWTYLRAYPRGPHAEQARRRLERLRAAVEVPSRFDMLTYDDVPPPREREYAIVEEIYPSPGVFAPPPPTWRRPPPPPVYLVPPQPRPVPVRVCPPGTTGTPPNCVAVTPPPPAPSPVVTRTCPPATTGTPPNCVAVTPPPPPAPPPVVQQTACRDGQMMLGTCQCMPPLVAVVIGGKGGAAAICTSDKGTRCPVGQTGTPPNCQGTTCPPGTTGTPPNCNFATCPTGLTGTPPNCRLTTTTATCPFGSTGTPPNCIFACPAGQTGLPCKPAGTATTCPPGQTSTPPNCVISPPPPPTPPAVVKNQCTEGQSIKRRDGCNCVAPMQAVSGVCKAAAKTTTTCPAGQVLIDQRCLELPAQTSTCPAGTTGTPPSCKPAGGACVSGQNIATTGCRCEAPMAPTQARVGPNTITICAPAGTKIAPIATPCPAGKIGTPPNCVDASPGDVACANGEDLKARGCVCIQPLQMVNVGGKQICKAGGRGTAPVATTCPTGQTGTPPNCKPAGRGTAPVATTCPTGQTGTPPNCKPAVAANCPAGQTGTPPNCKPAVAAKCPTGQVGTPPNCKSPPPAKCPTGQVGTPPNCKSPPPAKCPTGQVGTPPSCRPVTCPPGKKANAAGQCV